jgi:hypothetical protein
MKCSTTSSLRLLPQLRSFDDLNVVFLTLLTFSTSPNGFLAIALLF